MFTQWGRISRFMAVCRFVGIRWNLYGYVLHRGLVVGCGLLLSGWIESSHGVLCCLPRENGKLLSWDSTYPCRSFRHILSQTFLAVSDIDNAPGTSWTADTIQGTAILLVLTVLLLFLFLFLVLNPTPCFSSLLSLVCFHSTRR